MYYGAITAIILITMITMLLHIDQSLCIDGKEKAALCVVALYICTASVAEWLGVHLDGTESPVLLHALIKSVEFSLAPAIGALLASVFSKDLPKPVIGLLIANTVLEVLSAFTGFIFYVDSSNYYHHGSCYFIYILFYFLSIVYCVVHIILFSRRYQNRNMRTLLVILVLLTVGIGIQILFSSVKTDWLAVAIAFNLLFNYYAELSLQTDPLTTLLNRKCFDLIVASVKYPTIVFIFDADSFKGVNDTFGHTEGDTVLQTVAGAILETFGADALCYRIGGDEFCAVMKSGKTTRPEKLLERFGSRMQAYREVNPKLPYVSVGYADYPGHGAFLDSLNEADARMYEKKKSRKEQ